MTPQLNEVFTKIIQKGPSFSQLQKKRRSLQQICVAGGFRRGSILPKWPESSCFGCNVKIHPGRLTQNLKTMVWKTIFVFQASVLRFHVNLPGSSPDF